jgi:cytochrome c553
MKIHYTILSLTLFLSACVESRKEADKEQTTAPLADSVLINRGSYLVAVAGCNDCHSTKKMTPAGPVPDTSKLLAGYVQSETLPAINSALSKNWILFNMNATAFVGPWGISFAANLTPHETGIGNWSFGQFEMAMRKGKYKGLENSRGLLPPMPWMNYKDLEDQDMRAMFAYLKSLPPVNNVVPPPVGPAECIIACQ